MINHSRALQILTHLKLYLVCSTLCGLTSAWSTPFVVKTESVQFKPVLFVKSSYDTNVFYEAPQEPSSVPNDGILMKVGGGFALQNRHKNYFNFSLEPQLAYRNYLYIDDENGRISEAVKESRNGLDYAKGKAHLTIGTQKSLQLHLSENFSYIERPVYETTLFGFQRIDNRVGGELRFAPGSQNTRGPLELQAGYTLQNITFLEENTSVAITGRSKKNAHIMKLMTRWRFLPKNYLILDMNYTLNDYNDFTPEDANGMETVEELSRDSSPLRVQLGLTGLLSPRISVFLKGGYANTFNVFGTSFQGFIGLFQVSYVYAPRFELALGYQRDGRDSGFSNFYTLNRYFSKIKWSITSQVRIMANVSYDEYSYTQDNSIGEAARFDPVLRATLNLSLPLSGALRAQLGWSLESNYTDYRLPVGVSDAEVTDFAHYQRQLFSVSLLFN